MKLSNDQIEVIAAAIGILAVIPILGTIIWAILVLIFGLSVSWLQVVGGIIILDLLRSLILFRNKQFTLSHSFKTNQMTYKELLDQLQQLNEEQLNQDVAIWDEDNDEFYQQDVDLLFVDETQGPQ